MRVHVLFCACLLIRGLATCMAATLVTDGNASESLRQDICYLKYGTYEILVRPWTPGNSTLHLDYYAPFFMFPQGILTAFLPSLAVTTTCPPHKRVQDLPPHMQDVNESGVDCMCAMGYEPESLDFDEADCRPCDSFFEKDWVGNDRCRFSSTAITWLVIIGNVVVVAALVVAFLARRRLTKRLRAAQLRLPRKLRSVSGHRFPEMSLAEGMRWHVFLSHIWYSGQDSVTLIKQQCHKLVPGLRVFQDIDDLDDIGRLEEYIGASCTVVSTVGMQTQDRSHCPCAHMRALTLSSLFEPPGMDSSST